MNETTDQKDSRKVNNGYLYSRVYPGVWLIVIGVIFLLNSFGYLRWSSWGKLWPVFIIVSGVLMLIRPRR